MPSDSGNGDGGNGIETGAEDRVAQGDDVEIHVAESDIRDLKILDRSDIVFAVLYGVLFIWGLVLTLLSI
jgi:hypothetical protein